MAVQTLLSKFQADMDTLYGKFSPKTSDNEPYITSRPDDTNRPDVTTDTRAVPFNSIQLDFERMTAWSKSSKGLQWYLDQAALQTTNTFAETRIYDPAFVLGNTQPFVHLRRELAVASGNDVAGDLEYLSAASTPTIGAAGRLQHATSQGVVSLITNGGQNNLYADIIKVIPPVTALKVIGGILGILQDGILGVNQRPEFDMDGSGTYDQLYSVAIHNGFQKVNAPGDKLDKITSDLRSGNFAGAVQNTIALGSQLISDAAAIGNGISSLFGNRNLPLNITTPTIGPMPTPGNRYFITGLDSVDRYLEGTVDISNDIPVASLSFLVRQPTIYPDGPATMVIPNAPSSTSPNSLAGILAGLPSLSSPITIPEISSIPALVGDTQTNAAENAMKYAGASLDQTYQNDSRAQFIRDTLTSQQSTWLASIPTTRTGFGGGLANGVAATPNSSAKQKFTIGKNKNGAYQYFYDKLNSDPSTVIIQETGFVTSNDTRDAVRESADNLVDLFFFDFVNKKTIPFRAFITEISENIMPEWSDMHYVGRIERNIVYTGVKRELSFAIYAHAFNDDELSAVWRKINYLTGLCFPASYDPNGFLVPPLVKLTIGDYYNNQPGYIKSITYNIENDTPWEITPEIQVPHGIKINILYSVIEKGKMTPLDYTPGDSTFKGETFYSYGRPHASLTAGGSDIPAETSNDDSVVPGNTPGANRGSGLSSPLNSDVSQLFG